MSIGDTIKPYNTIGLPDFLKIVKDFNINLYPSSGDDPTVTKSIVFARNDKEIALQNS